jgi:pyruvate dehydrogenase E2 component (dihydrolipoamide acetyltransferase)
MAIPITIPRLGWNMDQGVFVGWLVPDGAALRPGQPLFTLEGEKATEDVENFETGILHIPPDGPRKGDIVAVGTVIGFVLQPGEQLPENPSPPSSGDLGERGLRLAPLAPVLGGEGLGVRGPVFEETSIPSPPTPVPQGERGERHPGVQGRGEVRATPRARRTAARHGVDWKYATGTGRSGRIRERDVLALFDKQASAPTVASRRIIAERMTASHRATAPVTLTTTIDATHLVAFRERCKATGGFVPTYTDLCVHLTAFALRRHPVLNARWEQNHVVLSENINIGIAVDTEAGLLVPVVRDVLSLSLPELCRQTRELVERARQRRLSASELQGGTFTVTSLGALGIDAFTPIINPPECAILGIGRIRRCPVVFEEQIVIRDQVTLSLTFDHRITDGAPAARFLQTLSAAIEKPRGST